jgi:hypothetical protein
MKGGRMSVTRTGLLSVDFWLRPLFASEVEEEQVIKTIDV